MLTGPTDGIRGTVIVAECPAQHPTGLIHKRAVCIGRQLLENRTSLCGEGSLFMAATLRVLDGASKCLSPPRDNGLIVGQEEMDVVEILGRLFEELEILGIFRAKYAVLGTHHADPSANAPFVLSL